MDSSILFIAVVVGCPLAILLTVMFVIFVIGRKARATGLGGQTRRSGGAYHNDSGTIGPAWVPDHHTSHNHHHHSSSGSGDHHSYGQVIDHGSSSSSSDSGWSSSSDSGSSSSSSDSGSSSSSSSD